MKKFKTMTLWLAVILAFGLLFTACGEETPTNPTEPSSPSEEEPTDPTVEDREWTAEEVFAGITLPVTASDPSDVGAHEWMTESVCKNAKAFKECVDQAVADGFTIFAENASGDEQVFATTLTKGPQTLVITYSVQKKRVWHQASINQTPSAHLVDDPAFAENLISGAKTTFYMIPVRDGSGNLTSGNCFLMQLKNGHFIIFDGGMPSNRESLIVLMQDLAPEGTKPVVEGWFLTHMHGDHVGNIVSLANEGLMSIKKEPNEKFFCNGIYYVAINQTSPTYAESAAANENSINAISEFGLLQTEDGKNTPIYRPHTGQVYHFADIAIDVDCTFAMINPNKWGTDNNQTSTCYFLHIDGNTFLNYGDAEMPSAEWVLDAHGAEHFETDVHAAWHHGINYGLAEFRNAVKAKILLFSAPNDEWLQALANKHNNTTWVPQFAQIKGQCKEVHDYSEGTYKLEFPIP